MGQEESWNQFALTGRVADYLEYRRNISEECNRKTEGSDKHEGNGYTDRNYFNSRSDERVR